MTILAVNDIPTPRSISVPSATIIEPVQTNNKSTRIEQHTIYQIPLDQRHGNARQLFTLWFGANLNVLTIVTGALATTVFGQSFLSGVLAILVGNLAGTIFMALHAAQGPRLGVPQMVQSRGQFGARGAAFVVALVIFFTGFNVLEAKLPALVSRAAPRESTGAATGVYSSVQFLGTFFGAAAGGTIAQHAGFVPVLVTCLAVTATWLAVAWNMGDFLPAASPASRT